MLEFLTIVGFSLGAFVAAAIATVMGFGVGTSLTPLFALVYSTHVAVLLVAVVHFLSNLFRLSLLRSYVDLGLVRRFGILSIVGALAGSFAQAYLQSDWLKVLLGVFLFLLGCSELLPGTTGWHFPRRFDQIAGFLSGLLGGLIGNQGAIRSAYLANYGIAKESFVATAALIAVFIDVSRIPVYLSSQWPEVTAALPLLASVTLAAFAGTYVGRRLLGHVSQDDFRGLVNSLIAVFGIVLVTQGVWVVGGETAAVACAALAALLLLIVEFLAQRSRR